MIGRHQYASRCQAIPGTMSHDVATAIDRAKDRSNHEPHLNATKNGKYASRSLATRVELQQ